MLESTPKLNRGRFLSWLRSPIAISALLVIVGVGLLPFDFLLSNPHSYARLPGDLKRVVSLSEIFAHGYGIFLVVMFILCLAVDHRKYILRILMCAIAPGIVAQLIKSVVGRQRPSSYFDAGFNMHFPDSIYTTWMGWMPDGQLNSLYGTVSFPSAHAATAWGLAIGLSWVFPRGRWLFAGIAIMGSIQRVTSYSHWSSDVVFGTAVAFAIAGTLTQNWGIGRLLGRLEDRAPIQPRLAVEGEDRRRVA